MLKKFRCTLKLPDYYIEVEAEDEEQAREEAEQRPVPFADLVGEWSVEEI